MRLTRLALTASLFLAFCLHGFGMSHARRGPTSPKILSRKSKTSAVKASSRHGGMSAANTPPSFHSTQIEPARATQIQNALIKSGYLTGEASGRWDTDTQAALRKLQGDNGWQTKITPDSRAIIKLGLGPGSDHAEEAINTGFATPATK